MSRNADFATPVRRPQLGAPPLQTPQPGGISPIVQSTKTFAGLSALNTLLPALCTEPGLEGVYQYIAGTWVLVDLSADVLSLDLDGGDVNGISGGGSSFDFDGGGA